MQQTGEHPADLANRVPSGNYRFTDPAERLGIAFARLRHSRTSGRFEAGLTPACDVMSLHLSPMDARVWRDGKIILDGEIGQASLSLAKAGVKAEVSIDGDIDIVQVFLPPETLSELSSEIIGWPTHPMMDGWLFDPKLAHLALRACRAAMSRQRAAFMAAESLALELAEHLIRKHGMDGAARSAAAMRYGGISPHRLRRLIDYIEANLTSELSLRTLAAQVNLSPYYFLRAFETETGITPHQWIMRRRISRAKQLLATSDLPVTMIAAEVGYASQSALTAAFSNIVGRSPAKWRELSRL